MHSVIIACTITTLITTYIYIASFKVQLYQNCIVQLAIVGDIVTIGLIQFLSNLTFLFFKIFV